MGQDTFYEITRRSIPLVKNDGIFLTWHDSIVCVRTDKGLSFFEFSYNLECLDKQLDIVEFSLPNPKTSPASELCKSKFINWEMENYDYTEMLLDSSFWPHNKTLTQDMTNLTTVAWSPSYFIDNKSVLALLNNVGGVQILIQKQNNWETVLDFSEIMPACLEYKKSPNNFEELKKSVYIVETSSIRWAPKLNPDGSCDFVTAQKNGDILFWQLFNDTRVPILRGKVQSNMFEIKNMLWITRTDKIMWLICADIVGHVNILEIQMGNDGVNCLQSNVLWEYKDRIVASYLNYMIINEKVVLFYSKHRHLVVQALDKNCNILSKYINNINDQTITDITSSLDGYYLTTIDVKIFKLNITLNDATLCIDLVPLELKEQFPTYELYNICFSKMNTLCAIAMIDRKLLCRKETLKVEVMFLTTDNKLNSIAQLLLNNPEKKLTHYFDCIETLRYKINKFKKMPMVDCHLMYTEGSNDLYKLKLYLILLIFFISMRRIARVDTSFTFPELSIEKVKEKILLLHAQSTIETLYKKHKRDKSLSTLDNETLYGCVKYLELYSKKHKTEILVDKDTLSIVKSDIKLVCQSCDDNILEGFTCKSGHFNMYCMLTFTPVGDDYLVCQCCDSTARSDTCIEDPLCVFCDQQLVMLD